MIRNLQSLYDLVLTILALLSCTMPRMVAAFLGKEKREVINGLEFICNQTLDF